MKTRKKYKSLGSTEHDILAIQFPLRSLEHQFEKYAQNCQYPVIFDSEVYSISVRQTDKFKKAIENMEKNWFTIHLPIHYFSERFGNLVTERMSNDRAKYYKAMIEDNSSKKALLNPYYFYDNKYKEVDIRRYEPLDFELFNLFRTKKNISKNVGL